MAGEQDQDIPSGDEIDSILNTPEGSLVTDEKPEIQPEPEMFSFKAGEKEIKATKDQMLKYAQQGYGANLRIGEQNQKVQTLEQKLKTLEHYKQLDDWAKQNPDKWNQITKTWEQPNAVTENTNTDLSQIPEEFQQYLSPLAQQIESLKATISEQGKYISEKQKWEQEQKIKSEDTALTTEVQSIQDKYKDLDWITPNESGHNLEMQVYEHASKIGTTSFQAAFKDLMFDKLMSRAEERGKEAVIKTKQQRTKMGLLDSPAPTNLKQLNYDPRKASDQEIYEEALKELGA